MKKKILEVVNCASEVTGVTMYKIMKNGVEAARGNNLKRLLEVYGQI
jgi:hypothetical protein